MAGATFAQSSTMGVAATVENQCAVSNAVGLAFGGLQMLQGGTQSSEATESTGGGTFNAICTNGAPSPKFKFVSANTAGANDFRLVGADSTTYIAYTVAESGGTAISHNTPAAFTGFTANGTVIPLRIKGSISAAAKVQKIAQEYSDTITITASFNP